MKVIYSHTYEDVIRIFTPFIFKLYGSSKIIFPAFPVCLPFHIKAFFQMSYNLWLLAISDNEKCGWELWKVLGDY